MVCCVACNVTRIVCLSFINLEHSLLPLYDWKSKESFGSRASTAVYLEKDNFKQRTGFSPVLFFKIILPGFVAIGFRSKYVLPESYLFSQRLVTNYSRKRLRSKFCQNFYKANSFSRKSNEFFITI